MHTYIDIYFHFLRKRKTQLKMTDGILKHLGDISRQKAKNMRDDFRKKTKQKRG